MSRMEPDEVFEDAMLREIRETKAVVKRMEVCLSGDEKMGHLGLVARTNNHAKRISRMERWSLMLVGATGALSLIYRAFLDLWPHK